MQENRANDVRSCESDAQLATVESRPREMRRGVIVMLDGRMCDRRRPGTSSRGVNHIWMDWFMDGRTAVKQEYRLGHAFIKMI